MNTGKQICKKYNKTHTFTVTFLSKIAPHMFQHALHMVPMHINAYECTPYEVVLSPALQSAQFRNKNHYINHRN